VYVKAFICYSKLKVLESIRIFEALCLGEEYLNLMIYAISTTEAISNMLLEQHRKVNRPTLNSYSSKIQDFMSRTVYGVTTSVFAIMLWKSVDREILNEKIKNVYSYFYTPSREPLTCNTFAKCKVNIESSIRKLCSTLDISYNSAWTSFSKMIFHPDRVMFHSPNLKVKKEYYNSSLRTVFATSLVCLFYNHDHLDWDMKEKLLKYDKINISSSYFNTIAKCAEMDHDKIYGIDFTCYYRIMVTYYNKLTEKDDAFDKILSSYVGLSMDQLFNIDWHG
jgi:hypothetical protein